MVQDSTLQIFLTIYHGQLLATFFYDYMIRNLVRLFYDPIDWNIVTNIVLGGLFIMIIIWAILSVWGKIRRNLIVCTIILLIMFIVRLAVGIPDIMEKRRWFDKRNYSIELAVFIAQMVIHIFGILATWMLTKSASESSL